MAKTATKKAPAKKTKNTNPRREGPRLSSVTTAIHLLKTFTAEENELGISQIAQRLGIAKSTGHRLASTLLDEGLLYQNPENGKYSLGIGLFTMGSMVRAKLDISAEAKPHLNELREKTMENVRLASLDEQNIVFLHDFESPHVVHLRSSTGQIKPAFCTAEGMCFMAHMNEMALAKVLAQPRPARTSRTITDEEEIRERLVTVRRQGYAIEDEECEEGTRCIAAPVFQSEGIVLAALGVAGPRLRLKKRNFSKIVPLVISTAAQISRKLGYVAG